MGRAVIGVAAGLFLGFVACFGWSVVAVVKTGDVVVAVACMCATLVSSFGLLMCHFVHGASLTGLPSAPVAPVAPRRIEVAQLRAGVVHDLVAPPRVRHATVCEGSTVALASRASPHTSPSSPTLWVFEPSCDVHGEAEAL